MDYNNKSKWTGKNMKKNIIILSPLILLIFLPIYSFWIETNLIQTKHLMVGNGLRQVRIVQISDLHMSKYYTEKKLRRVVKKINQQNPDIVVFTGDLLDNYAQYTGDIKKIIDDLSNIKGRLGKYAVWGNHDYGGGATRIYRKIMEYSRFQLLENSGITLSLPTQKKMFIGGLDDGLLGNPSVKEMLSYRREVNYSIVLAHEPDMADKLLNSDIQLILSGHSHGEQVRLPVKLFNHNLSSKYSRGFYDLANGTKLYVNKGLGTTHIPIRFGAVPEISVLDIHF